MQKLYKKVECLHVLKEHVDIFNDTLIGSVIKRPTDSTTSTSNGLTDTTSGQTDTTSGQIVLRLDKRVLRVLDEWKDEYYE